MDRNEPEARSPGLFSLEGTPLAGSYDFARSRCAGPALNYGRGRSIHEPPREQWPMNRGVMFQYFEWNSPADGSLWRELAERAVEIKNLGSTAVWLPPADKAVAGAAGGGGEDKDLGPAGLLAPAGVQGVCRGGRHGVCGLRPLRPGRVRPEGVG